MRNKQLQKLNDGIAVLTADGNFTPTMKEVAAVSGVSYNTIKTKPEYRHIIAMLLMKQVLKRYLNVGTYESVSYDPIKGYLFENIIDFTLIPEGKTIALGNKLFSQLFNLTGDSIAIIGHTLYYKGYGIAFKDDEVFQITEENCTDALYQDTKHNVIKGVEEQDMDVKYSKVERELLALGIHIKMDGGLIDLTDPKVEIRDVIHILLTMVLRRRGLISGQFTQGKQREYGRRLFRLYARIISGSGRVPYDEPNLRWFNEKDTKQIISKLFTRSGYQAGVRSMEYKPTPRMDDIIKEVFEMFSDLDFKEQEIEVKESDILVPATMLPNMKFRDNLLLLAEAVTYSNGTFIVRPKIDDNSYTRVYSVFTSISSETRKSLGYHEYDVGSALPTIVLQVINHRSGTAFEKYPLHKLLMDDKKAFRSLVMAETGYDYEKAKKTLSVLDNEVENHRRRYANHDILFRYFMESLEMRKEFISLLTEDELIIAKSMAKDRYKYIKGQYIAVGKKESSVFFHGWTQFERYIRASMKSCFKDHCWDVHDAIYSKEVIPKGVVEKMVLDQTGIKVIL